MKFPKSATREKTNNSKADRTFPSDLDDDDATCLHTLTNDDTLRTVTLQIPIL